MQLYCWAKLLKLSEYWTITSGTFCDTLHDGLHVLWLRDETKQTLCVTYTDVTVWDKRNWAQGDQTWKCEGPAAVQYGRWGSVSSPCIEVEKGSGGGWAVQVAGLAGLASMWLTFQWAKGLIRVE